MALVAVANTQAMDASQVQQLINLLTGVMTDQQVTLRSAASFPLLLDRSDAAGIKGLAAIQRAAATKYFLGLDAADQGAILNALGTIVNLGWTDLGLVTARATLGISGGAPALSNPVATKWVGSWTTLGPPAGLTGVVGDWGQDANGNEWWCTAAGTPGTWRPRGIHLIDFQQPSGVASFDFVNPLPLGYDWLEIIWQGRESGASATDLLNLRFNNDSGGNYYGERTSLAGATWSSATEQIGTTSGIVGVILGSSVADATMAASGRFLIPNHTGTTWKKGLFWTAEATIGLVTSGFQLFTGKLTWNSTAAITRITMLPGTGNFVTGSWFKLLGGVF